MNFDFQMIFNVVIVAAICIVGLVLSFSAKAQKAEGKPKEIKTALAETIGAGIILFFIVFAVFAAGYYSS